MADGEGAGAGAGAAAAGAGSGQPDAVLLAPLTEETFLHNLHVRYKRDLIYTYVGNALVSVNPCRPLPLYSAELVRAYLARAPHSLPPHLYAITAAAYRWVRDRNESQCIVITGESGAGKTEAARVCLQCAVVAGGVREPAGGGGGGAGAGGGGGGGGGAGAALTAAGTLLEAFGNAATARNHNASRFGKLLDIEFDFRGQPVGGHITHWARVRRAGGRAELPRVLPAAGRRRRAPAQTLAAAPFLGALPYIARGRGRRVRGGGGRGGRRGRGRGRGGRRRGPAPPRAPARPARAPG